MIPAAPDDLWCDKPGYASGRPFGGPVRLRACPERLEGAMTARQIMTADGPETEGDEDEAFGIRIIAVGPDEAGGRVDKVLADLLPEMSRARVQACAGVRFPPRSARAGDQAGAASAPDHRDGGRGMGRVLTLVGVSRGLLPRGGFSGNIIPILHLYA